MTKTISKLVLPLVLISTVLIGVAKYTMARGNDYIDYLASKIRNGTLVAEDIKLFNRNRIEAEGRPDIEINVATGNMDLLRGTVAETRLIEGIQLDKLEALIGVDFDDAALSCEIRDSYTEGGSIEGNRIASTEGFIDILSPGSHVSTVSSREISPISGYTIYSTSYYGQEGGQQFIDQSQETFKAVEEICNSGESEFSSLN